MIKKCRILNVNFNLIDYVQVFETICQWKKSAKSKLITITPPHSVLLCGRDERMAKAHEAAGLTLPDGVGVILAANILGYKHHGRVTGPNLMLKLCDWGRKYNFRHCFYGGTEEVLENLSKNLTEIFPGLDIAGLYSPPFRSLTEDEDRQIIEMINNSNIDILWAGLGAPKQEIWMLEHLGKIKATAIIGIGAAFDFHSGNVKWAPAIVRKLGIEWAWRLVGNPRRMWRRNLDSPLFLSKVILQKIRMILGINLYGLQK
jgi:N-acetylglucosaminyldiphosphoundecaprenol N-acetyl-beta-D-mannosaminyltransferase